MLRRVRPSHHSIVILAACGLALSCASAPKPDANSASVWGFVRLVPKAGAQAIGGGYGDRRLASAKRVDYSHTTYAVVFVPTATDPSPVPSILTIREASRGTRILPLYAYANPTVGIRVTNETTAAQMVSMPSAGRLVRIAPGESVDIQGLELGEASLHLLGQKNGRPTESPQIWVTNGIATEVESSGRFTLGGLAPGNHELRAWHPRFPPSPVRTVGLEVGSVRRVDIEIGVDVDPLDTEGAP